MTPISLHEAASMQALAAAWSAEPLHNADSAVAAWSARLAAVLAALMHARQPGGTTPLPTTLITSTEAEQQAMLTRALDAVAPALVPSLAAAWDHAAWVAGLATWLDPTACDVPPLPVRRTVLVWLLRHWTTDATRARALLAGLVADDHLSRWAVPIAQYARDAADLSPADGASDPATTAAATIESEAAAPARFYADAGLAVVYNCVQTDAGLLAVVLAHAPSLVAVPCAIAHPSDRTFQMRLAWAKRLAGDADAIVAWTRGLAVAAPDRAAGMAQLATLWPLLKSAYAADYETITADDWPAVAATLSPAVVAATTALLGLQPATLVAVLAVLTGVLEAPCPAHAPSAGRCAACTCATCHRAVQATRAVLDILVMATTRANVPFNQTDLIPLCLRLLAVFPSTPRVTVRPPPSAAPTTADAAPAASSSGAAPSLLGKRAEREGADARPSVSSLSAASLSPSGRSSPSPSPSPSTTAAAAAAAAAAAPRVVASVPPSAAMEAPAITSPALLLAKSDVMRILSNLCWRNPDAQNRVRTEDGIPVVLNHCVIDDTNPYLKEVALFCIRNLCESNPANQAAIEQLKAEEVLPESTMTKLGLGEMNTAVF